MIRWMDGWMDGNEMEMRRDGTERNGRGSGLLGEEGRREEKRRGRGG